MKMPRAEQPRCFTPGCGRRTFGTLYCDSCHAGFCRFDPDSAPPERPVCDRRRKGDRSAD